MDAYYDDGWVKQYCCHVLEGLRQIPDGLAQMVMTSPPYWGLRNYAGGSDIVWGGEINCEHEWLNVPFGGRNKRPEDDDPKFAKGLSNPSGSANFCSLCGAWKGQLGLEPTWQLYAQHIVEISREIRRVLRKDGSYYLVLGDTYAGSWGNAYRHEDKMIEQRQRPKHSESWKRGDSPAMACPPTSRTGQDAITRPKQKLLIPYRVAMALQEDGWLLRNDITWHKPNSMPSSVKDRLTCTTESIFHFVKQGKYYYDLDAIREPHKVAEERWGSAGTVIGKVHRKSVDENVGSGERLYFTGDKATAAHPKGKNPGDVIQVGADTRRNPPIRPHGKGWDGSWPGGGARITREQDERWLPPEGKNPGDFWEITTQPFKGAHFAVFPEALCIKPILASSRPGDTVLDPLAGSGTVGVVAKKLGRRAIIIDVVESYCEIAKGRIEAIPIPLDVI